MRAIILFVDDTEASEDLRLTLEYAKNPPWLPRPERANWSIPQERMSPEDIDKLLLALIKRAAPHVYWSANVIAPERDDFAATTNAREN